MKNSSKILIALLLTGIIASFAMLQVKNKELIKGQIFDNPQATEALMPDLIPSIESLGADENGNLKVKVTMENRGEGAVPSDVPYSYGLYINDELVLTNTDSYLQMNAGDKFSFVYPVDKEVYSYDSTGSVKIIVDEENAVEEADEGNNVSATIYEL